MPIKCIQEYIPVKPEPPDYPVLKEYMDFMLELIKDLEIGHIFVHADEIVYAKLCHILWKDRELYKNVLLLIWGFHQLRVMQHLIYKRYHCRGMQQWCVDAEIIAKGSAEQAFEGSHFYRCMRMHKEYFDALVQLRNQQITKQKREINTVFKEILESGFISRCL